MTHIVALGIVLLAFALVPALTWRRYRRSPRTIRDRRQFIGRLSFCGLMGAFLAATHFTHGDELPGWVSYLGDLAYVLVLLSISQMFWNGDASANDAVGQEQSGEN